MASKNDKNGSSILLYTEEGVRVVQALKSKSASAYPDSGSTNCVGLLFNLACVYDDDTGESWSPYIPAHLVS